MKRPPTRKIGITGHTSGIGKEIYEHCMFKGHDVTGYSRATGFNILEKDADNIINDILRKDIDVVFNNAWVPKLQIKILKVLHQQWKDREGKFIISTGSASIYQAGLTGEVYQQDKKELRDYSINAALQWPYKNACRVSNVSLGWTNTALVGDTYENFIDPYEAALVLLNMMEYQDYVIPEVIISNKMQPPEEVDPIRDRAAAHMGASIIQSNKMMLEKNSPTLSKIYDSREK